MNDLQRKEEHPVVAQESALISMIERVAVNPEADIEKLERLMDMQERAMDRNAKMAFDAALATMQGELPEVEKLAKAHNDVRYAKFEHVLAAVKPVLVKYGFAITHRVKTDSEKVTVTAILSHMGGHREETEIELPHDTTGNKNKVQAVGSSIEYGRRYSMNSILGIATRNADTDGNVGDSSRVLDWIAKFDECAGRDALKAAFTEAWNECTAPKDRQALTNAKNKRLRELADAQIAR